MKTVADRWCHRQSCAGLWHHCQSGPAVCCNCQASASTDAIGYAPAPQFFFADVATGKAGRAPSSGSSYPQATPSGNLAKRKRRSRRAGRQDETLLEGSQAPGWRGVPCQSRGARGHFWPSFPGCCSSYW